MSPVRQDWLQRMLDQLSEQLAAIGKARIEGRLEEAHRLIEEACRDCLGMEYGALTAVDARSTATLLGHPERVRVLARLVGQDAEVLAAQGHGGRAGERADRARLLEAEADRAPGVSHGPPA